MTSVDVEAGVRLEPRAWEESLGWFLFSPEYLDHQQDMLEAGIEQALADATYPDSTVITAHIDACIGHDSAESAPRVRAETLVIASASDRLIPVAHSEAAADSIPNAELHVIEGPGSAHAPGAERSEDLYHLASAFLSGG